MTFWRNVLPNMLLHGQNALLVVSTCLQNFYQCNGFILYNGPDAASKLQVQVFNGAWGEEGVYFYQVSGD